MDDRNSREALYKTGLHLEYFTVAYNVIEASVSLLLGGIASSIALIGFGLDSIMESISGFVLIWRLRQHSQVSEEKEEKIERRAVRFVGVTFLILGAYVLFQSAKKLDTEDSPAPSVPGIVLAFVSLTVMPLLALKKYRVGREIQSRALIADSKETLACFFLSLALLLGLGLNYLLGFWQADPLAGMVIALFLFGEGWEGVKQSYEDE
ncbi:hypothetical protein AMJ40_05600 [candidate division TA06 bacterium DG_26]|uniref:Cation efflux protein transmembrane domain-containing protein n=1 Tax=candidate division TA06 bacterium DG_26 TaxID=1703771 RepID=A0A0S7WGY5_UNCT6|nr:MAG: hypothetical protein AMJ40_05600 [candidate division TA06 bacterium DG_26]